MAKLKHKIYLASRYSRREELLGYKSDLENRGFEVTSKWIDGTHEIADRNLPIEAHLSERRRFALEDFNDLMEADICISFTEEPRSTNTRGGRHVEFGISLATGKKCYIVGPVENVFHCLPTVIQYDSFSQLVEKEGW